MLLPPPSSLPFKIFALIFFFLLLLSSSPLDINRSGIILFAEASRAYPHGCLYRHPSYYTYDERDDISWFNHQNNSDEKFSAQLSTSATTTAIATAAMSSTAASDFTDYRKLPPKNHPIRRSYEQYKLLRRLGAGKFSNVFEAVDVYMAAASVYANNNDDDDAIQKKRRKKITSSAALEQDVDDALSNEATTTTDSSDNESTTSQSSSPSTKPVIDSNTLVVLKCLKPISERKIRRELLVLTHCQNLPNLARLIGIVIPSSMDVEEENNDGKGAVIDDEEGNDAVNEKRVNGGGEKESRRHHQSLQQQQSHNRKRRRYSHRTSRQSQQKQHNQQRRRQQHQDIGSITTDAHNLPEKDANHLSNKKNVNNGNNNGGNKKNNNNSQQQHGEEIPALVLEHAGQRAQWFCHGPRPSSISSANKTAQQTNMYRGRHSYQNHLTEYEMKYYLCHLLIALDGLHAAGIMHRDVKPRNTLINLNSEPVFAASSSTAEERKSSSSGMMMDSCALSIVQSSTSASSSLPSSQSHSSTTLPSTLPPPPLMLVDLGLADFYLPGKEFNVRVASRHYKSPELLIGYEYYDYAIDMWSVGCILAGLLFRIEPFFRGVDNEDQLGQIVNCLGTRDFLPYCRKCNVRLSSKARAAIGKYCSESSSSSSSSSEDSATPISFSNSDIGRRKPWLSYLTPDCPIPSSEATDLLDKLLVYDHEQRWTAREALGHTFFDEVRDEVWNEVQERIRWESQRRSLPSTSV